MYDVKSMKATEFIDHGEIEATLAYADANKDNLELIDSILNKARQLKGLTHREVILHHVLRNSFIPIVTNLPMSVAMCITGSFFIESVFSIPGLGLYYVNAVAAQDVTIVMGETVILAALYIIVVFVTDILYTVVDPRIRIRGGKR